MCYRVLDCSLCLLVLCLDLPASLRFFVCFILRTTSSQYKSVTFSFSLTRSFYFSYNCPLYHCRSWTWCCGNHNITQDNIHWDPVTVYLFSQSVIWCIKVTQIWFVCPDSIPLLADCCCLSAHVAYVMLSLFALFCACSHCSLPVSHSSYCPSVSLHVWSLSVAMFFLC